MKRWIPGLLFAACLLPGHAASQSPARITWDAFAAQVNAIRSLRMVLPDGTQIEGYPLAIRPDGLDLRVGKTSNPRAHPKGRITVARETVSVVEIRKQRRKGRLIGTLVPIGAGAAVLAGATVRSVESPIYGLLAAGGLTMGVGAPVGYFVGRAIDRRYQQFIIVPAASTDTQPGRAPRF